MPDWQRLILDTARGLAWVAALGAVVVAVAGSVWFEPVVALGAAVSFAAGTVWGALNFAVLGWLVVLVAAGTKGRKLFIFALACAKIPALYLVLYLLYRWEQLSSLWLTAGLVAMPAVLVATGLKTAARYQHENPAGAVKPDGEEGSDGC
jgi:hypothetical protein